VTTSALCDEVWREQEEDDRELDGLDERPSSSGDGSLDWVALAMAFLMKAGRVGIAECCYVFVPSDVNLAWGM
jgi:hypothetical protein